MADDLRLGTRGSRLALWQANAVAARIVEAGGPSCRIVPIRTTGDHLQEAPLSESGGKRLFVKEIEDALLRGEIDLAVHSSKDMPAVLPDGLVVAGVLPRENPHDAVVLPVRPKADTTAVSADPTAATSVSDVVSGFSPTIASIEDLIALLGQTPSIGTSSVRRIAQLTRLFPCGRFDPIRGNLDTRLRKLDTGPHDALVLAAAGLKRLGFGDRISFTLPADVCVPAPGQGIVAIQTREGDAAVRDVVARISDDTTAAALDAERALVEALGGGCQTPVGALATAGEDGELELAGAVIAVDGSRAIHGRVRGPRGEARLLGKAVAAQLLAQGAADILSARSS